MTFLFTSMVTNERLVSMSVWDRRILRRLRIHNHLRDGSFKGREIAAVVLAIDRFLDRAQR